MPQGRPKPTAADAMQWRALGSMLLLRKPALNNLLAAYPSQTVHWPEPNMPTPLGPCFFSAALNLSVITVNASSHDTGVNSPFLSNTPFVLRSMGRVRRSCPYIILERK